MKVDDWVLHKSMGVFRVVEISNYYSRGDIDMIYVSNKIGMYLTATKDLTVITKEIADIAREEQYASR